MAVVVFAWCSTGLTLTLWNHTSLRPQYVTGNVSHLFIRHSISLKTCLIYYLIVVNKKDGACLLRHGLLYGLTKTFQGWFSIGLYTV